MADMDLDLDLDLQMEGEGLEADALSPEEKMVLEADDMQTSLAEDLEGFAKGFTAAWDLEPPENLLK